MRITRVLAAAALTGCLAVAAVACGVATGGAGAGGREGGTATVGSGATADGCRVVEAGEVALVVEALAYDVSCIDAPAGEAFTIAFENRDGAPHNVTIEDASGTAVFDGEHVMQGSIGYAVPALDAGEYPFHCHVHPDMRGVLRVG